MVYCSFFRFLSNQENLYMIHHDSNIFYDNSNPQINIIEDKITVSNISLLFINHLILEDTKLVANFNLPCVEVLDFLRLFFISFKDDLLFCLLI